MYNYQLLSSYFNYHWFCLFIYLSIKLIIVIYIDNQFNYTYYCFWIKYNCNYRLIIFLKTEEMASKTPSFLNPLIPSSGWCWISFHVEMIQLVLLCLIAAAENITFHRFSKWFLFAFELLLHTKAETVSSCHFWKACLLKCLMAGVCPYNLLE